MSVTVIVGCQWGDEGKGKITDFISRQADIVARYQGGNNAGHTIVIGEEKFVLHTVPSGIINNGAKNLIGNGVVIDLEDLNNEISELKKRGIKINGNLFIAENAHLIMPYHKIMDGLRETSGNGVKIGTTKKGIGYAYADKYARKGIRVVDCFFPEAFMQKLEDNLEYYNYMFVNLYDEAPLNSEEIFDNYMKLFETVKDMVIDGSLFLNEELKKGKNLLCEGAQGTMLDIDFGTYPYVTSSNPITGGVCTGLGIGPTHIKKTIGILKAYTTRVGEGPFPTELNDEIGQIMREKGHEYGATTGRPRRCGWFDATVAKRSVMLSGINEIALMKIDVLDGFEKIKVCTGYKIGNKILKEFPLSIHELDQAELIYEEFDGWTGATEGVTEFDKLPENAKKYIKYIEELIEAKISIISTGPKRSETIILNDKYFI